MDLNNFTAEMQKAITDFKKYWEENNKQNPDAFPLNIDEDNSGIWLEQFLMFLSTNSDEEI